MPTPLQWVDDHAAIFRKRMRRVAPAGALAAQMPGYYDAPAHCLMRILAQSPAWRGHFPAGGVREWHVDDLAACDILAPATASVDMWQTEYLHILPDAAAIVQWYKGTGLRPFLNALTDDQQRADHPAHYLELIRRANPARGDGRVIFPFRGLFMIAYQR